MLRWFWNNLSSFLLALVLALTVWVLAVSAEDPIQVRTVAASIPVELINSPANQILINEVPQTARLTLRAPTSVWNELQTADISIWADLSGLGSGQHTVALQAEVSAR